MQAADVMARRVVTVEPATSVREVARVLVRHGISAVPVVDGQRRVLGIVSEGDLLRPAEVSRDARSAWWLEMLAEGDALAPQFLDHVRSGGRHARDVMSHEVVTVPPTASLHEIATLLERHRIKRVPVVADGHLVGIVSRADLVRAMAHGEERRG